MSKRATIYEIAKESGVSASTVARILSGRGQGRAKTRALVLAAAQKLNYRMNMAAQSLSRGGAMSIGVLVPDIGDPFFVEVLRGIERGLHDSPYFPLIASMHWRLGEQTNALDLLLGHRVGGLIVATVHPPAPRVIELAHEMPLVLIGNVLEPIASNCIAIDNREAAYRATQYLIGLGHRQIAYISGPIHHWHTAPRFEGFRAAMTEAGLELRPELLLSGNYDERSGMQAVEGLLERGVRFTALFASNDVMAYGARLALFHHGIGIPDQVSLMGFDDLPFSSYLTPPLTSVRQPGYEMGLRAAKQVLGLLNGQPELPKTAQGELIIRGSTAMVR